MKILVTGGAGFIGSNVADAYINAGHDVVVIDDLSTGLMVNLNPKARFYELDVRSREISGVFESERPDVVNHHAAQISVVASVKDPVHDADVNICGLLNVLEAAKKTNVKKMIFSSSGGAVYGEATECPTSEDCAPRPVSPYAIAKFTAEMYLQYYKDTFGLDFVALRYSNVFGARQRPDGEAGVVAIFMENIANRRPSTIFSYAEEPDGMYRDYCNVRDVVAANMLSLDRGAGIYNIGTGRMVSTRDLYEIIVRSVERYAPDVRAALGVPLCGIARKGELKRSCLDYNRAKSGLSWQPLVSLEEGIDRIVTGRFSEKAV